MSLSKKYLKTRPFCKVTFRISAEEAGKAKSALLLGDFNDWHADAGRMKRLKGGGFTATVELPVDRSYQFRYCLDGENWVNEGAADAFEYSPLGACDNSVVRV